METGSPGFRETCLSSHPHCTAHCCVTLSWWSHLSEPTPSLYSGAMMDDEGCLKS